MTLITVFFLKLLSYYLIKNNFLGTGLGQGSSDANYYNNYAIGLANIAVNIWPIILRYLETLGLYSREGISYILFFINLIIIPFLVVKLTGLKLNSNQKYFFYIILVCAIYPTMFIFTFDVYRDVFMVFSFLVGCITVKGALKSSNFISFIFYFIISIAIGLFLLNLRPYLGYAFLLSLLFWKLKLTKKRVLFLSISYFLLLFIVNYAGLLTELTDYRSGFEEGSGSTLGLDFSNPIMFVPNFILSFLGQMLGLYITNPLAIVLLLIETVPFFFMLVYVIKNIKLADNFVRFLIIFFVIYGSVWLIGNDNLGTAVRLRMYNYLSIYISFFYILRLKNLNPQSLKVNS